MLLYKTNTIKAPNTTDFLQAVEGKTMSLRSEILLLLWFFVCLFLNTIMECSHEELTPKALFSVHH